MAQTITLTQSAYKDLIERLSRIEKSLSRLMASQKKEPPYGTNAWWEWSDKQAMNEMKKENTIAVHSKKEMQQLLDSYK